MANVQNQENDAPSLGREILAVVLGFVALFLLICLLSYQPDASGSGQANWGGVVGTILSQALMGVFGFSSFWFSILLFLIAVRIFLSRFSLHDLPFVCGGVTGILVASGGLFAASGVSSFAIFDHTFPSGGILGNLLYSFLGNYFGGPGSVLLFILVLLVSLMVSVRFSVYGFGCKVGQTSSLIFKGLRKSSAEKSSAPVAAPKEPVKVNVPVEKELPTRVPNVHEPVAPPEEENEDDEFQTLPVLPGKYQLPSINLLDKPQRSEMVVDRDHYFAVSKLLEDKLKDFGVIGKVEGISPGPVITTYEFAPAPGVKINKIVSLADDLALGLKAESVRIVGSIPGKAALGIEIPNPERHIVYFRDIAASESFQKAASRLSLGLGMDVVGHPVVANLARMPHLLIAGATGAGKSVAINTIIGSILMKSTPAEVRMLMVDPKRIELSAYEDIPHLLHPVVVDPKLASRALQWAVREMERRYQLMEEARVKSLAGYNEVAEVKLPLIVIIIDELADLMMVSSREVEDAVARLAQMARAAGMHLILATQRPSVDVLTGLIKANFPTRISFKVSSKIDSRTIIDTSGAEHLLGAGDMLFLPPGVAKLQRIHGAYISEPEIERIVSFLKKQGTAQYEESMLQITEEPESDGVTEEDYDEKYDEALAMVCESGQASISMVQRRLRIGYNRAARMIERMEREGVVGPADGAKPREVLVRNSY
ncbi:MAG: DNA translocase FtsK 4TM domain-containing protein [Desulfobulbaceae bacterium]|nr:DNA translocase FtsK 4TM domain-containing protein [Desulfobulbaceae bacterium]